MMNQHEEGVKVRSDEGPCDVVVEPAMSPPIDCDAMLLFNNSDLSSTRRTDNGPS